MDISFCIISYRRSGQVQLKDARRLKEQVAIRKGQAQEYFDSAFRRGNSLRLPCRDPIDRVRKRWNAERFEVSLLLPVLTVRNLFVPLYCDEVNCEEICIHY